MIAPRLLLLEIVVVCAFNRAVDIAEIPAGLEIQQDEARDFKSFKKGEDGAADEETVQQKGGDRMAWFTQVKMPGAG